MKIDLRPFEWSEDWVLALWEARQHGSFRAYSCHSLEEFLEEFKSDMSTYDSFFIMATEKTPICFIFLRFTDGVLEPHVEMFPDAKNKRIILAAYNIFFAHVLKDTNIRVCYVRSYKSKKHVFDYYCRKGVLHYVKKLGKEYHYALLKEST